MWRPLPLQSYWVIWLFGENLGWKHLLHSYPCPSYWVIWLFGENLRPPPSVAILVKVIGLFGYLIETLCGLVETLPSVAILVKVIGLFGYLVKILDGDTSSIPIPVQVIWLFGRNPLWRPPLLSYPCQSYWVIW